MKPGHFFLDLLVRHYANVTGYKFIKNVCHVLRMFVAFMYIPNIMTLDV